MGNLLVSCVAPPASAHRTTLIRILHYDTGSLSELEGPLTAAEVMLDYPAQFLCACGVSISAASSASCQAQRIVAVPADEGLKASELYVLLPMQRLNTRFSVEDTAMLASRILLSRKRASMAPSLITTGSRVAPFTSTATATSSVSVDGYGSFNSESWRTRLLQSTGSQSFKESASPRMSMNLQEAQSHVLMSMASTTARMCRSRSWMPKLETITEM